MISNDIVDAALVAGRNSIRGDHTSRGFARDRQREDGPTCGSVHAVQLARRRPCWLLLSRPPEVETSEAAERERGRISKIRARLCLRLDELYTAGAVGSHESQTREQEVVLRFPTHIPRHYPVYYRKLQSRYG